LLTNARSPRRPALASQSYNRKERLDHHAMVTRKASAQSSGSTAEKALRALLSPHPHLPGPLEILLARASEEPSVADLRIDPLVGAHRNPFPAEPFFLPRDRFGGSQDVPMASLIRTVVDETLHDYAATSPHLQESVGRTPISPYGSMGLSVSRWGYVDWDYIRDLDWRIFLPPEIGHLSGFKTDLERTLTQELRKYALTPVLFGKDEQGQPQVQLLDKSTEDVHGFHFFLIAMKPEFVRGNIHRDGGYSPHFAYFPEDSLDEHLESAKVLWPDLISQQREDYIEMFNQLSFNIFGENSGEDRLYKTRGWYLHKAFKWYATLARVRGLSSLEEDLLYQYEHFRGSEAELSYLARYRYFARMEPSRPRMDDVDRDLARALSITYARARNSLDPTVGQQVNVDAASIILLEAVSESLASAACRLLAKVDSSLSHRLQPGSIPLPIRFADNLSAPRIVSLDGENEAVLIPAEWSMVFCDSYVSRVVRTAAKSKPSITGDDLHEAFVVLLASLVSRAFT
jgi:hypothetical protein